MIYRIFRTQRDNNIILYNNYITVSLFQQQATSHLLGKGLEEIKVQRSI